MKINNINLLKKPNKLTKLLDQIQKYKLVQKLNNIKELLHLNQ